MEERGVSVSFNISSALGDLEAFYRRLSDLTPLMEEIGATLEQSALNRFETKTSPDGEPWATLAARTIKERIKRGYGPQNTLRRSGHLARSINYQATGDQVIISMGGVGNSLDYAAAHQFGATIEIKPRQQKLYYKTGRGQVGNRWVKKSQSNFAQTVSVGGYTIVIPARPVLGVSREDEIAIGRIAEKFLKEGIDG